MNDGISKLQMEDIFEAAGALTDAGARRAFLQEACPHDPVMRVEIEKLLALQSDAERFFAEAELATQLQKETQRKQ
jgi:hypothetical protein